MRRLPSPADLPQRPGDGDGHAGRRRDDHADLLGPRRIQLPRNLSDDHDTYNQDIAAASGASDNVFSVNQDLFGRTTGTTTTPIKYLLTAGDSVTDTTRYPASGCTLDPGYTVCLTDAQLEAELASVLQTNGLAADRAHLYVLFFPPKVETVVLGSRSATQYCGIHLEFSLPNDAGTVVYGDDPYPGEGCTHGQAPNGNAFADGAVSTFSHEVNESITDPTTTNGWFDSPKQRENGDECAENYGSPLGSTDPNNPDTTLYNQVINGHQYYTQTNFSNARFAALGMGNGCTAASNAPGTAPVRSAAIAATQTSAPATATLDASPTELAADGTDTSTVTVEVLDAAGEPVAGDHIHWLTRSRDETPGQCGTLSTTAGRTNADGKATVVYTASTANIACYVLATEARGGHSNEAVVYQGAQRATDPVVTQRVPASVTAGGPPATFTASASNPSATDIPDVRFDVFLSGDNQGTAGVDAAQVHLSYADSATGGRFVAVPLTGTTRDDGEIEGLVAPNTAADLPAGATRTVTFRLSLDPSAAATITTGSPLRIETDLQQFNPADGSQANLGYAGPTDVPVLRAPTATHLNCDSTATHVDRPLRCGVSVSSLSTGPATAPTGTVLLATNVGPHHGAFSDLGRCTLVTVDARTARCSFSYTPNRAEATTIYANYTGDPAHAPSHTSLAIGVLP